MRLGLSLGISRQSGGGAPAPTPLTVVPLYGQSLSLGSSPVSGGSVISGAVAGSFMLNGGVRFHYDEPGRTNPNQPAEATQAASLATLQEQLSPSGGSQFGETFASGMALRMPSPAVMATSGRGAYSVDQLRPVDTETVGWIHFANTYAAVEAMRRLGEAEDAQIRMGSMIWKQGEADAVGGTTRADYKTKMLALHQEFLDCLPVALGEPLPANWKMIIDQQGFQQPGATYGEIAVAAIELHREHPDKFVCAGPTYLAEYENNGGDVHFTSNGYRNYGEKLGEVQDASLGSGWSPCHITSVSRTGTTITVNVYVPVAPLVKDTALVSAVDDDGFNYTGANITAVTITNPGSNGGTATIEITLDADAAGTLEYAYENNAINQRAGPVLGPRGNIRDSSPFVTLNDSKAWPNFLCVDRWTGL